MNWMDLCLPDSEGLCYGWTIILAIVMGIIILILMGYLSKYAQNVNKRRGMR